MGRSMRKSLRLAFVVVIVAALAACSQVAPQSPTFSTQSIRMLVKSGTSTMQAGPQAMLHGVVSPEFSPMQFEGDSMDGQAIQQLAVGASKRGGAVVNRIPAKTQVPMTPPSNTAATQGLSTQAITTGANFEGLNLFDQRTANNGNQFTVEPPDQGLCVGNGYVLEAVNDVLKVFNTDGSTALGTVDLNTFYHYAPAIDRNTGVYGPGVTDPSCMYDAANGKWLVVSLTLDYNADGSWNGRNTLDIAVSSSEDPVTSTWSIYHLDVTNDGQHCPCLGDYPHIGMNANGFFITTNNFPLVSSPSQGKSAGYNGSWVYAFDKTGLEAGDSGVSVAAMPARDSKGVVGYSVWPAASVGRVPVRAATASSTS